ncbi:MAG: VWA domain-containing protein [Chloroflexi bacterium]|nr:VWA domain-containing protein [Chloroflexota bacterium]OJV95303.1 MAG: hypothetical protein BGO39_25220 [Chloroflexi bacterium 54-19]
MQKRPLLWATLFMLVCLSLSSILAACGGESATRTNPTATPIYEPATPGGTTSTAPTTNATAPGTTAASTTAAAATTSASGSSDTGSGASTTAATATTAASTTAAAAAASSDSAGGSSEVYPAPAATPGSSYSKPNQPVYNQQPLKAGAVDDNVNFTEYMQYLQGYRSQDVWPLDVSERYIINVVDGNGRTVSNATVKIYTNQTLIFQGKTYSNGQVLFFPKTLPSAAQVSTFDVTAEKDGQTLTRSFQRQDQNQNQGYNQNLFIGANWTLNLNGSFRNQQNASTTLDLLFLLDSTGSMGGEIRRIQQTISDIAYQITALPGQPRLRFGIVTYRDRGDSYVTRKYGFTENLGDFSNFLNSISAGGGGDYPESLNEALHVAVNDMNWSSGDALRLAFLVADAPPHLDYPKDYKYTNELVDAVRQGIKVYTIGASGLTPPGEYIFRQLAEITLAQYIFITRGGDENRSGSGGPASNTGIAYNEQTLDQIVVGIVRQELNNLTQ